jgi:hypothetical protein
MSEQRSERERGGKQVLALARPRHRLDLHGVDGEDGRGEPRAGHGEPHEEPPREQHDGGVRRDVHRVVAGRVEAPEPVLDPERGVDERVVLRHRADAQPDVAQPPSDARSRMPRM